ncbi:substrate-binding periplasmic protein [Roseibium sp.]|uniref:substrate-binding periplasmic protein n=1 Tax=Roseibium sp. TaxID=1936156 RepID=UPI003B529538
MLAGACRVLIAVWFAMHFISGAAADQKTLHIASIDWCPQLCIDGDKAGYITDIVEQIFEASPYDLAIKIYPWSRAIQYTRAGRVHALLSPAKAEAPDLVYPAEEIGVQRMCFFVLKENPWTFEGTSSLEGHLTAVATDTSIEELNEFISKRTDLFFFAPYSDEYLKNSIDMLMLGRVNSFLFTHNSTVHAARRLGMENRIRQAGCVSVAKVYMAFSPTEEMASDVAEMRAYFDSAMAKFKSDGRVSDVMAQYGLSDWTQPEDVLER